MRLSYANVTATLALFVALSGSAYAVTLITGKDIAPRTITARNIKKGTLTSAEVARGSITRGKLARGVRAMLPAESDSGFGNDGGFPIDSGSGFPGEPGLTGDPGEPGPAGPAGCDASGPVLCPDEDLPSGRTAMLRDGGTELLRDVRAYRTSCDVSVNPDCTVILSGLAAAARQADDFYRAGPKPNIELVVVTGATVHRVFTVANSVPVALRNQSDGYQLTLNADSVIQTVP